MRNGVACAGGRSRPGSVSVFRGCVLRSLVLGLYSFGLAGAAPRAARGLAIAPEAWALATALRDVPIPEIQGAGHRSPHEGELLSTAGVVSSVGASGFTLQDPDGDRNPATSDALFVFVGSAPPVALGDRLRVVGRVVEFVPGGAATGNLSVTEIERPLQIERLGSAAVPEPLALVAFGRGEPPRSIDDDGLARFDADADAIDYFESLESMRVVLPAAVAAAPEDRFGAIDAFSSAASGPRSARGVRARQPGDDAADVLRIVSSQESGPLPRVSVGAELGSVRGVIDYRFGRYELRAEQPLAVQPSALLPERTALARDASHLTAASYNLANLAPDDPQARYAGLARQICEGLGAPDILALQELQDSSGERDDGNVDASRTAERLTAAIRAAGGPDYRYVDLAPEDGADGGAPGANIRVAYLYDPSRVELQAGGLERWGAAGDADAAAFAGSRKPLHARFAFGSQPLELVNLHLRSRVGSAPRFGALQPAPLAGAAARLAQARAVATRVAELLAAEPGLGLLLLGDFNASTEEAALEVLLGAGGPGLVSLDRLRLPPEERYSFLFEGGGELLDHALLSPALLAHALPEIDIVHLNSEFSAAWSDHDPLVVRLFLPVPEPGTGLLVATGVGFLTRLWSRIKGLGQAADSQGEREPICRFRASVSATYRRALSSTRARTRSASRSRRAAGPGCASSCGTTCVRRQGFPSR